MKKEKNLGEMIEDIAHWVNPQNQNLGRLFTDLCLREHATETLEGPDERNCYHTAEYERGVLHRLQGLPQHEYLTHQGSVSHQRYTTGWVDTDTYLARMTY